MIRPTPSRPPAAASIRMSAPPTPSIQIDARGQGPRRQAGSRPGASSPGAPRAPALGTHSVSRALTFLHLNLALDAALGSALRIDHGWNRPAPGRGAPLAESTAGACREGTVAASSRCFSAWRRAWARPTPCCGRQALKAEGRRCRCGRRRDARTLRDRRAARRSRGSSAPDRSPIAIARSWSSTSMPPSRGAPRCCSSTNSPIPTHRASCTPSATRTSTACCRPASTSGPRSTSSISKA